MLVVNRTHLRAWDAILDVAETDGTVRAAVDTPARFSTYDAPGTTRGTTELGGDEDYVYGELPGLDRARISELIEDPTIYQSEMNSVMSETYSEAIGRTETLEELITPDRSAAMAATLDHEMSPGEGAALPPGWHWLYFNPFVRRSQIGHDGHPKRGSFLPAVKLPRRMWAGGRLTYHDYLTIGKSATKDSEILNVVTKTGRTGELVFVTVRHRLSQDGRLCIEEEQDIVYREAPAPGAKKPEPAPAPEPAARSVAVTPDPVLLFRYSALTSNGHRIHYDRAYAQQEEDYRDLVVHGPLTATLLQGFAVAAGHRLTGFEFRGMAPLFVDRPFSLQCGDVEDGALPLWARGPDGELAMQAKATFSG